MSFWKLFKRQSRSMLVVNVSTALVTSQSSGRTSLVAFPKGSLICAWSAIMVNLLKLTLSSHARGKGPAAGQPGDLTVVWAVPFQVSVMLMSGKKQKQWHFQFGGLESDNEKNGKKCHLAPQVSSLISHFRRGFWSCESLRNNLAFPTLKRRVRILTPLAQPCPSGES